jgi:hypothetical protein
MVRGEVQVVQIILETHDDVIFVTLFESALAVYIFQDQSIVIHKGEVQVVQNTLETHNGVIFVTLFEPLFEVYIFQTQSTVIQ